MLLELILIAQRVERPLDPSLATTAGFVIFISGIFAIYCTPKIFNALPRRLVRKIVRIDLDYATKVVIISTLFITSGVFLFMADLLIKQITS